jgi:aspartyl/glutamyl-tRNA(Asn/Gln) amidotransferase C subunit
VAPSAKLNLRASNTSASEPLALQRHFVNAVRFHAYMQVADWAPKIESIVGWFGQLQDVDVEGVAPAVRAEVEASTGLRADVPQQLEGMQETLMQAAPDKEGDFVRVPKTITVADG